MNKEVKKLWVDALRSGEYKQGKNYLVNTSDPEGPRYCCLGVLCDLATKSGVDVRVYEDGRNSYLQFDSDAAYLPLSVSEWAGLSDNEVPSDPVAGEDHLAGHNDNGKSFPEIADLIEEHL